MNNFKFEQLANGHYVFDGVMDKRSVAKNWAQLKRKLTDTTDTIIDLSKVHQSDSAGIALLICLQKQAHNHKKQLAFINIPRQVQQLIELNHLQDVLKAGQSI